MFMNMPLFAEGLQVPVEGLVGAWKISVGINSLIFTDYLAPD
jgi:hypothetical protein